MNRVLKKAASFLTAVVVSASAFAATVVPASAASAKTTAKQTVANSYDMVTVFENGAFFSSKSKYVLVDNTGKKVSVKNTIGFDKIYTPATMSEPAVVSKGLNITHWPYVLVSKGKKFAAILSSGKYLANGKLFNSIDECGEYIAAASGNTTYVYNAKGKKLATIKGGKYGVLTDYEPDSKVSIFTKAESYDDWGFADKSTVTILDKNSKILIQEENVSWASIYTGDNDKYIMVSTINDDYIIESTYYNMKGAKLTDEQAEALIDNGQYDIQSEPAKHNLTANSFWNDELNCYTLNVCDPKGSIIYTAVGNNFLSEPTDYMWTNGKLIIAAGDYVVIDDATGKVEYQGGYDDINGIMFTSTDKKTILVQNYDFDSILLSIDGKELYKTNGYISPNAFDNDEIYTGVNGETSYTRNYIAKDGFIFTKNEKYGILDSNGKEAVKAKYDSIELGNNGTILAGNSGKYSIFSSKGKTLAKNLNIVPMTLWFSQYLSSANADVYITQNKAGTKFGCYVVKTK